MYQLKKGDIIFASRISTKENIKMIVENKYNDAIDGYVNGKFKIIMTHYWDIRKEGEKEYLRW